MLQFHPHLTRAYLYVKKSCRIHTSYVAVEPRRRRQNPEEGGSETAPAAAASPPIDSMAGYQKAHPISPSADSDAAVAEQHAHQQQQQQPPPRSSRGAPLRRARMIITVKRTEEYKQWLHDNPAYAIFSAGGTMMMWLTQTSG